MACWLTAGMRSELASCARFSAIPSAREGREAGEDSSRLRRAACAVPRAEARTDRRTDRREQPPPLLTSAKKAVVVILWLSNTLLSVGTRFLTIRGSLGPAWRAMALRAEGAASPTPGQGSTHTNSAKFGSERKGAQHQEQTSPQIYSTGVTGGQEPRDSCAHSPRDPRAERGEELAPSPAPWGCQRVGAHRVPLPTAPAGPAGRAAKAQAAPSPVGSSPRPRSAIQAPGGPGSPHPLSISPCPAAAAAWTHP